MVDLYSFMEISIGLEKVTVDPEIFARILFLQIALKDILATGKFRN